MTKYYCPGCDRQRSKVKDELCNSCREQEQIEREAKPFRPKFADIYMKPNCDAKDLILSYLDGSDHERGRLEEVSASVENVHEAFARMVQILFEREIITKEDVGVVADAYDFFSGGTMTETVDPIDREKPKIHLDETLCSGCWNVELAETATKDGWKFYDFKHFEFTVLCPECQYKYGDDFDKLKESGL